MQQAKRLHNKNILTDRRKELRNGSTPEEIALWPYLKNSGLGHKFRRQHSIGPYIVDFYCPQKRIIIELDGSPHNDTDAKEYDQIRDDYLRDLDFVVLRFWNSEISKDLPKVLGKIKEHLNTTTPVTH
jgi:very-short-patch-repair endonuclease